MLSGSKISDPPPDRTGVVAVVINGRNKHFGGAPACQDLSAQIRYGRLTGLVGPDGAGKTTLMRILTGLLVPSSGRATVAGFDVVADNDAIHVATGYMPQRLDRNGVVLGKTVSVRVDLGGRLIIKNKTTIQNLANNTQ